MRDHISWNGRGVSSGHVDDLHCSVRVIRAVSLLNRLVEKGGCIRVDDDCGVCFKVVYSLAHGNRVIVEIRRRHGDVT